MRLYAQVLNHRLLILLDDARHDRLVAVARSRGVSVATVVDAVLAACAVRVHAAALVSADAASAGASGVLRAVPDAEGVASLLRRAAPAALP